MKSFEILVNFVAIFAVTLGSQPCTTKLGLVGTCNPITECEYLTDLLNLGDFSDLTSCDFDGSVGVFCCPLQRKNAINSHLSQSCLKLIELKERLTPNLKNYNEVSSTITIGELPHMAQVMFPEKGFVGAGALISKKFVLTSAHVVYVRCNMPFVRLGKTTIDDEDNAIGLDVKVKQIIPHELYQPREVYYDIALLLLETTVKFYNHIWPACLHNPSMVLKDDQILSLSGWQRNGKRSNAMIKSDLRVVANLECQRFYSDKKYEILLPNGVVDENLLCATNVGCDNSGADSDGTVYYYSNNTFFVYAIATNIQTQCESKRPGIYIKITDVLGWIERIIL